MKFHKVIPYKIRRALSMAAIIGAPILPIAASCHEIEPEPTRDVEIKFNTINFDETFKTYDIKKMQELSQDKTVRYIYLSAQDHWNSWRSGTISALRTKVLQPRIELSPKIRGRGDFDFVLGEASKVPNDSLWFVKNGWTINKNNR